MPATDLGDRLSASVSEPELIVVEEPSSWSAAQ
jgi:hypothetical protein